MDFGDAPVIAGEEAVEDLGEPDPRLAVDPAHDAEIDRGEPAVGKREEIALVEVGVEEAVDHRLAQEGADEDRGERLQIVAGVDQRLAVGELDAVDPFEGEDAPGGAGPVDRGDEEAALGLEILPELGGGGGFLAQVQLAVGPLAEGGDDHPRPQPRHLAAHRFDLGGRPFVGVDRGGEILLDVRAQDLDRDQPAFGGDRAVDLGDRGGADRLGIDRGEDLVERLAEALLDRRLDLVERRRAAGCPGAKRGRAPPPRRPDRAASPAPGRT